MTGRAPHFVRDAVLLASRMMSRATARIRRSSRAQRATFTAIFNERGWGDIESVSGPGSTEARGADFRDELIALIDRWQIRSIVDAPCGDFNWMRHVLAARDLPYTGIDIVEELIARNAHAYTSSNRRFACLDMTRDELPRADLIICRDALVHLSFADARAAVRNFRRSGSRYLLATTFVEVRQNTQIPTGGWRVLNMEAPPFSFPAPLALVDERCTHSGGIYRDKRLGLWEVASLDT